MSNSGCEQVLVVVWKGSSKNGIENCITGAVAQRRRTEVKHDVNVSCSFDYVQARCKAIKL